jgi:hypothetical protein
MLRRATPIVPRCTGPAATDADSACHQYLADHGNTNAVVTRPTARRGAGSLRHIIPFGAEDGHDAFTYATRQYRSATATVTPRDRTTTTLTILSHPGETAVTPHDSHDSKPGAGRQTGDMT